MCDDSKRSAVISFTMCIHTLDQLYYLPILIHKHTVILIQIGQLISISCVVKFLVMHSGLLSSYAYLDVFRTIIIIIALFLSVIVALESIQIAH